MVTPHEPDFMEWIEITDEGRWKLKDEAPENVKEAYREWEKDLEMIDEDIVKQIEEEAEAE